MATVDEEEHAVLDRLTFDYHQKLQGKPQSHELVGAGRPAPPAQPCRATHPPAPPWVPSLVTGRGVGQLRRSAPSQSSSSRSVPPFWGREVLPVPVFCPHAPVFPFPAPWQTPASPAPPHRRWAPHPCASLRSQPCRLPAASALGCTQAGPGSAQPRRRLCCRSLPPSPVRPQLPLPGWRGAVGACEAGSRLHALGNGCCC